MEDFWKEAFVGSWASISGRQWRAVESTVEGSGGKWGHDQVACRAYIATPNQTKPVQKYIESASWSVS